MKHAGRSFVPTIALVALMSLAIVAPTAHARTIGPVGVNAECTLPLAVDCPRDTGPPTPFATVPASAPVATVTYKADMGFCAPAKLLIYDNGKKAGETPVVGGDTTHVDAGDYPQQGTIALNLHGKKAHTLSYRGRVTGNGCGDGPGPLTLHLIQGHLIVKYRAQVVISGSVFGRACRRQTPGCVLEDGPVAHRPVFLSGKHSKETDTDTDGSYSFTVSPGRYTVRVPGKKGSILPASRTVRASGDVPRVDFSICHAPSGYSGPKFTCGLARVDLTVLDSSGNAYPDAVAYGLEGHVKSIIEFDVTDSAGHVELILPVGHNTVVASDSAQFEPGVDGAKVSVQRAIDVKPSGAKLTLVVQPQYALQVFQSSITHRPEIGVAGVGLSTTPGIADAKLQFKLDSGTYSSACATQAGPRPFLSFGTPPKGGQAFYAGHKFATLVRVDSGSNSTGFCAGSYTMTITNGGSTLFSGQLTLPVAGLGAPVEQ